MPTDYRINLSKGLTSSPDERKRFYNGMLFYLAGCAALLVAASYFAAVNVQDGLRAQRHKSGLVKAVTTVSEFSKSFYKDPDRAYAELQQTSAELKQLQQALANQSHFLPVLTLIVSEFPEDVALQGLRATASNKSILFEMILPLSNGDRGNPSRKLQQDWDENDELQQRIKSIRPVTSERQMVAGYPVSFVQFECILK